MILLDLIASSKQSEINRDVFWTFLKKIAYQCFDNTGVITHTSLLQKRECKDNGFLC